MIQHSKLKSILYHLYPGVLITLFFGMATPYFVTMGFPPQLSMLIAIVVIVAPVILLHLNNAKKHENAKRIIDLVEYKETLPIKKLILYTLGLIFFAFVVYGMTQPINEIITDKLLYWLPDWYKVRDFEGYSKSIILITLIVNLILNGLLAPYLEELYFRGYLLPRMQTWGKYAPLMSAILFSFYHFWQPQIYLTLVIALFPMTYLVWKTKSLKLAIYTHCGLNIVGALLSFGMINQ